MYIYIIPFVNNIHYEGVEKCIIKCIHFRNREMAREIKDRVDGKYSMRQRLLELYKFKDKSKSEVSPCTITCNNNFVEVELME